jgi:mannose-6-phosphate isomerase-like protein (cupin superfamily)
MGRSNKNETYDIDTDVMFGPLESFDVAQLAGACGHEWSNRTLCRVNDCVLRLGVLKGEFHWHKHEREDEVFYVVDGELTVELEGRSVVLGPSQGISVPRGAMHRTLAPERTVVLMIEGAGVNPTGD